MFNPNPLSFTDSYNFSHWRMFPKGVDNAYYYIEARVDKPVLWYGLQPILKELSLGFTQENVENLISQSNSHFKFNEDVVNSSGFRSLFERTDGKFPLHIKAAPEGLLLPGRNVLMTIQNTDIYSWWLPGFLEAQFLHVWYPTTVATLSFNIKQIIKKYLEETGNPELLNFKLHDFGFRATSCPQQGAIGGSAHLVNFEGTDTFPALDFIKYYYGMPSSIPSSIPAANHASITSWQKDSEEVAYSHILQEYSTGPLAIVSDSYDIYNAVNEIWGKKLRDKVSNRDGLLVIRPDSCAPGVHPSEQIITLFSSLGRHFGYLVNKKGYQVLNDKVRLIWGDGLTKDDIELILSTMKENKWSADNITFGMGSSLLNDVSRKDLDFTMKLSAINRFGTWRNVKKSPVSGNKTSKAGLVSLFNNADGYYSASYPSDSREILRTVFLNGILHNEVSFDEIRKISCF